MSKKRGYKIKTKDLPAMQATADALGKAMGYALPLIAQHEPKRPEDVGFLLERLDELHQVLTPTDTEEPDPMNVLVSTFINALFEGLNETRTDDNRALFYRPPLTYKAPPDSH